MLALIAEFIFKLFTGEIFRLWTAHKQTEASNAQNKVSSMSDAAVSDKLRYDWTIKS